MRVRTTCAAVVVVGLAMGVGAVLLLVLFRESLTGQVETAARLRAAEIARVLQAGSPVRALGSPEDLLVQLVDDDGTVLDSSPAVEGRPVLARPARDDAAQVRAPGDGGAVLVVSRDVTVDGRPRQLMVGRALVAVEAIRRDVATITAADLHRRVPDPGGADEAARLGLFDPATVTIRWCRHRGTKIPTPGRSPDELITQARTAQWRARCVERRTGGSGSGPRKRTGLETGTAPRADFHHPPRSPKPSPPLR